MSESRTIIVGGGLAGIAAASALAERSVPVTLLEARPRLGGRASSFLDRETGTTIDNCQHVTLGCCTNFRHFCQTIGIAEFFRTEKQLYFVGPPQAGKAPIIDKLAAAGWPAPFHLLPAFKKLSYLSPDDKRRLQNGLRSLANRSNENADHVSFAQWLAEHDQSPSVIERFWHVVLVSALSETPERISLQHGRKVFVDAFLSNRHGWEMSVPTVPLDDLYGGILTNWLQKRNVEIRLQCGIAEIEAGADNVTGVVLRDGERLPATQVILAVPHFSAVELLPESVRSRPEFAQIASIESAPISSVHLWFDREIAELPHAVLVERLSQWVFNRSRLQASKEADKHYYQVVISASRSLAAMSQEQVIAEVRAELESIWPAARLATLQHARVVTEHKAVFSPQPGIEALRPIQRTPLNNLQLAGDWTQTGWPSTMEGAVRSGYLAAQQVLTNLGESHDCIEPNLPAALLSKLLFRL